ncbi:MAG: 3'(2'),5'-bisphosphate nucleotidase CysQ [Lachnospiraceae bacterium]|nr:3'(2'),5'-bisphosphate nucleotidase CysQ [Lachnospiraceae bacterium]MEE3460410.1 3'(2'),5'-bisphosphate nucleotidase CysQ [Lachnospiraceae bacterium]
MGNINNIDEIVDSKKVLEVIREASLRASNAIMDIYRTGDFSIERKADDSPLTRADKASNAIIVKALRENFPDFAILSEEEKDNKERMNNDFCFVVDPLDGTKEFIKKNGQFTTNIALTYKHRSVLGLIELPVKREVYWAALGKGSYMSDDQGNVSRIHVSQVTGPDKIRVVESLSHNAPEMDELIQKYNIKNFVQMGSSIKGCLIARGDAELYYRHNPTMEWDTCAMQIIAEEAGAIFRQMDDSEMLYNREDTVNRKGFYIINDERNRLR